MTVSPQQSSSRIALGAPDAVTLTGWGTFAAIMLVVVGAINIVNGLTLLDEPAFITGQFLYQDITFWGWALLVWGVLQAVAGVLSFGVTSTAGPAIGIGLAAVGMVIWTLLLFTTPYGALVGIAINGLIVYGMTARTSVGSR